MYGLTGRQLSDIRSVLSRYPQVESAILYGSRARGDYKTYSDVDIVLKGNDLTHVCLSQIEAQLDDLLLPYSIDLSDIGMIANPALLDNICRDGIIL